MTVTAKKKEENVTKMRGRRKKQRKKLGKGLRRNLKMKKEDWK